MLSPSRLEEIKLRELKDQLTRYEEYILAYSQLAHECRIKLKNRNKQPKNEVDYEDYLTKHVSEQSENVEDVQDLILASMTKPSKKKVTFDKSVGNPQKPDIDLVTQNRIKSKIENQEDSPDDIEEVHNFLLNALTDNDDASELKDFAQRVARNKEIARQVAAKGMSKIDQEYAKKADKHRALLVNGGSGVEFSGDESESEVEDPYIEEMKNNLITVDSNKQLPIETSSNEVFTINVNEKNTTDIVSAPVKDFNLDPFMNTQQQCEHIFNEVYDPKKDIYENPEAAPKTTPKDVEPPSVNAFTNLTETEQNKKLEQIYMTTKNYITKKFEIEGKATQGDEFDNAVREESSKRLQAFINK